MTRPLLKRPGLLAPDTKLGGDRNPWLLIVRPMHVASPHDCSLTDRALQPLRAQLRDLDQSIFDQEDMIAAVKAAVFENEQRVQVCMSVRERERKLQIVHSASSISLSATRILPLQNMLSSVASAAK